MFLEHDEMKFAILYTLKRYVEPISEPELNEILTWEKQVMGYFDLSLMLNELIEDGYVLRKHYRDEPSVCLTPMGEDTTAFFYERVPASIRRRIDEAVGARKFDEQADPNAVKTEIIPVAQHQYMASLQMLDANLPMLEIQIYAGTRADAENAAKRLQEQASEIYGDLLKRITSEER